LDVVTKEFLDIEFKRTQYMRSNHVDEITAVAQKQYNSLLMGLQAICQNKGWKVQQLDIVGRTCGSVHVESFNSNMKALGVLESKWDLFRRKLVRCLWEEQDKVLRSYLAQRGGMRRNGRSRNDEPTQGARCVFYYCRTCCWYKLCVFITASSTYNAVRNLLFLDVDRDV
jgi:hypothetical protein